MIQVIFHDRWSAIIIHKFQKSSLKSMKSEQPVFDRVLRRNKHSCEPVSDEITQMKRRVDKRRWARKRGGEVEDLPSGGGISVSEISVRSNLQPNLAPVEVMLSLVKGWLAFSLLVQLNPAIYGRMCLITDYITEYSTWLSDSIVSTVLC